MKLAMTSEARNLWLSSGQPMPRQRWSPACVASRTEHDVTWDQRRSNDSYFGWSPIEDWRIKSGAILHFVDYDWADEKAESNLEKHGVSLEEAATVFGDPLYIDFYDPDHAVDEHRYLIMGQSTAGRLLIISYTERDEAVRLITAREVTSAERRAYEEG